MQNDHRTLPEFLVESNPQELTIADFEKATAHKSLRHTMMALSLVWVLLIVLYLHFGFGWQNLSALLPLEFAQFVTMTVLPLLLVLLLTALIFKASASAKQAQIVHKSLAKILFNDDKNILSSIFDQQLRDQIGSLAATVNQLSTHAQTLKKEMNIKAEDFAKISTLLETNFMNNLQKINEGVAQFSSQCQTATEISQKVASDLSTRSDELKASAQMAADTLNPLINETVVSAEHFQNILENNKNYIAKANDDLKNFAKIKEQHLNESLSLLNNCEEKIEQSFLKTADRCGEIFKQLDSGVSHVEASLKNHKEMAAEQAALIDKNSNYLDSKLGEYGRLISLEVEEMIKRSSTLELNVKKQLEQLRQAGEKADKILNGTSNSLEQNTIKAVKNIEKMISGLDQEISKLSTFMKTAENKNNTIETTVEKISQRIGAIGADLSAQIDNLKSRSVEAIDKFNEVGGLVQKNALQLSETANVIAQKGKENSASLAEQTTAISETAEQLENVKKYFADISTALTQAGSNAASLFAGYKSNVVEFNTVINRQLNDLSESRRLTEAHLEEIRQEYAQMDMTNFIDKSTAIIQNLNNISVDFNQFFNAENDEALWKKFYSGDYTAFARNVVKNLTRKQIIKIRSEYEKNGDFRQMTDRYIDDFETLLNGAQKSEKPQVLMALLSNSDLGKIYYIMARALDRLE